MRKLTTQEWIDRKKSLITKYFLWDDPVEIAEYHRLTDLCVEQKIGITEITRVTSLRGMPIPASIRVCYYVKQI